MTFEELNTSSPEVVRKALQHCCGSQRWVGRIMALRPFRNVDALLSAADEVWSSLGTSDWLEAFTHHPKIGQKSAVKWPSEEQRGMETATIDSRSRYRSAKH